jgi:glycosyltransferase involved in cell wall biosynthesis
VRVAREQPAARLLLVGDGATRRDMEVKAAALGIAPSVTFTGRVPHDRVPALMASADIAVAPYTNQGGPLWLSPLKLYEYMASGTAIVASRMGQIAEVIADGRNGVLVAPGDPDALAAALVRLLGDAREREALGSQAREDATRRHSWTAYIERLEQIFEDAIAAHHRGAGRDARTLTAG